MGVCFLFMPVTTTTLGNLVFDKRDLVYVDSTTTANDALSEMRKHNISSVLVKEGDKFVAFVSSLELMTEIAFGTFQWNIIDENQYQSYTGSTAAVSELLKMNPKGQSIALFEPTELLSSVLEPLCGGLKRVLVKQYNGAEICYRVLSQFDVIRFIVQLIDEFKSMYPDLFGETIQQLQLASDPPKGEVVSVKNSDPALIGFRTLVLREVVSAPIVNDKGEIVSTLSATDIRGVKPDNFSSILKPVTEFLSASRPTHPVTCVLNETLAQVITKMVVARVHHVWVVNSAQNVIGVVSCEDILRLLLEKHKSK